MAIAKYTSQNILLLESGFAYSFLNPDFSKQLKFLNLTLVLLQQLRNVIVSINTDRRNDLRSILF